MTGLTCLFNPLGCASSYIHSLPLTWLLGGALVAGLIIGAMLGRWGVAALIGLVALFAFTRRGSNDPIEQLPDGHPDARPSHPKPRDDRPGTWNAREGRWN